MINMELHSPVGHAEFMRSILHQHSRHQPIKSNVKALQITKRGFGGPALWSPAVEPLRETIVAATPTNSPPARFRIRPLYRCVKLKSADTKSTWHVVGIFVIVIVSKSVAKSLDKLLSERTWHKSPFTDAPVAILYWLYRC